MNGRDRVLAMIEARTTDSIPLMPITMMFAADWIGVEYGRYATDHRTLVEAQIRTAEAFDFDHVSCISDPTREAADCGARIEFFADQPPAIVEQDARLANKADLVRLHMPDPLGGGRMHDRVKAAALLKERVGGTKLIEGWIEGPIAEAADLRGLNTLMLDLVDDPGFVRDLFAFVVEMELQFAKAQIEAGVELIGVGDAAASLVGPRLYQDLVWPYEKQLVDGLHALGTRVRLHICGKTRQITAPMGTLSCEIVDLDSMTPLSEARTAMGPNQLLLGNINPVTILRNGTPEEVRAAIAACHREAGPRYIVGAGCEVPRETPDANLRALCAYAREHRP
ncbi:MAG: uroporphyrinogen decarboxylase family protein [Phycisphaerae bacterium]|nr:uroporphyrinogen decarboxylase family protein [Phycisphaerae bacterium]